MINMTKQCELQNGEEQTKTQRNLLILLYLISWNGALYDEPVQLNVSPAVPTCHQ